MCDVTEGAFGLVASRLRVERDLPRDQGFKPHQREEGVFINFTYIDIIYFEKRKTKDDFYE